METKRKPPWRNPDLEWWENERLILRPILENFLRQTAMAAAESAARQLPAVARYQVDWALVNEAAWRRSRDYSYELVKGITETSEAFLKETVSEWIDTGQSLDALVGAITEGGMFGARRAQMISVTEVTRAYADGNRMAWAASGAVDKVRWQTAVDERVCPSCGPMHNQTDVVGGDFEGMGPPAHVNCLPGDSRVLAQGVTATSERWYDGELVVIDTASGNHLACTPNHPVLTPSGWIAAGLLDVGGYVISDLSSEWIAALDGDGKDMPPHIEDVVKTFRRAGDVVTVPVPTTAEDFHGDGVGSEVAVVRAKGLLSNRVDAAFPEHVGQFAFGGANVGLVGLSGEGTADALGPAGLATARSDMSGGDLGGTAFGWHLRPLERFGFASPPDGDTGFLQPQPDSPAVHTIGFGQGVLGLTGEVFADEVVGIQRDSFHGYVYNLQTVSGHYTTNGIITHNCRCWIIPVVDPYGAP